MGKKNAEKSGGEEKKGDSGEKNDGPMTVVLKADLHCEGCVKKIKRSISNHFDNVAVKVDIASNKLTVIGKVDPAEVKKRVEEKTHKGVEIVSPQPKKDGGDTKKPAGGSDKKPDDKSSKEKGDEKKPKEPSVSTVVLNMPLHCVGCARKIKRTILKIEGVDSVSIDNNKDLVTVKGTMDAKELAPYLKDKFKRNVGIVAPKKEQDDKKGKGGADKGEKKDSGGEGKNSNESKGDVNKMEYHGMPSYLNYGMPMYNQGYMDPGYGVPMFNHGYPNPGYIQGYTNHGYMVEYSRPPPPMPPPAYLHPQMFSDENPNACTVM